MNCVDARVQIENGADDRNRALSDHLAACEACRKYVAVGAMLSDAVRAAPVPPPPPEFVSGVMSAWRAEQSPAAEWRALALETWEIVVGEFVQAWWNTRNALAVARDSITYAMTTTLAVSRAVIRMR